MKKILFISLAFMLCACGESQVSSIVESSNSIEESSISQSEIISESKTDKESEITSSSVDPYSEYEFDDSYFDSSLLIGENEKYNLSVICKKEYFWLEIVSEDLTTVKFDLDNNIIGVKEGTSTVTVLIDETYYDQINVEVKSKEYMSSNIKLDEGRLYHKTFAVFGDSISDNSVSNYKDKPLFWNEKLVQDYDMTMYNYAKSGSTTGYSYGLMSKGDYTSIIATYMVNTKDAKEKLKECDYAFIYSGNNDASYGVDIGNNDDINEDNYLTKESFKGSYNYLINKIYEINPNIQIICLGLSYSTWSITKYNSNNYATSRQELTNVVKEIAEYRNLKYIELIDLWNGDTYPTYAPDGIHPSSAGYELIVERLLNS